MNPIQVLWTEVAIFSLGALGSLFFDREGRTSRAFAGWAGILASITGMICAATSFSASATPAQDFFSLPAFGHLVLRLDALSAFLVALISLIGMAASLYSLANAPLQKSIPFFTNLFLASMLLVVTSDNAFFFLIFWEIMTLASYFLVTWNHQNKKDIQTGYIYFLVAHVGAALIMLAFFLLFFSAGSLDFQVLRQAALPPTIKNLVFILVLLGFGAKAGMVPLHFWAPDTYAAAPDHVSALMAAVMKKTAIYGFLRICVDVVGVDQGWWGLLVLAFGALSTVVGAFYSLPETHIKRLLAYSSVENVGIILMGVGIGMQGLSAGNPLLTAIGFIAALYHALNHAFFKSLLFLSAGTIIEQSKTTDLNRMGGLARRMPYTAVIFLVGAISVSALPPLNGFISEWFIYQAFFSAAASQTFILRVFAPLCAMLMALSSAIAAIVYIKAYSGSFSGPERIVSTAPIHDPTRGALLSQFYLAAGCIFLGTGAPLVIPYVSAAAAILTKTQPVQMAQTAYVFPADTNQAILSPPLILMLLAGLLIIPLVIVVVFGGQRAGKRTGVEPWSCGYGYSRSMSISASSFYQPVSYNFHPLFWLRSLWDGPAKSLRSFSQNALKRIAHAEPVAETIVTRPTARLVETASQWIQTLQMGDIRVYCLYIIITLAVLLIAIFGRSGL